MENPVLIDTSPALKVARLRWRRERVAGAFTIRDMIDPCPVKGTQSCNPKYFTREISCCTSTGCVEEILIHPTTSGRGTRIISSDPSAPSSEPEKPTILVAFASTMTLREKGSAKAPVSAILRPSEPVSRKTTVAAEEFVFVTLNDDWYPSSGLPTLMKNGKSNSVAAALDCAKPEIVKHATDRRKTNVRLEVIGDKDAGLGNKSRVASRQNTGLAAGDWRLTRDPRLATRD